MSIIAAGYRRVSTDEQAEQGHSLETQLLAIENFAAQRGWELGPIYTDAGVSGQLDERPGLLALLENVKQGRCDVVVVHSIDRFYRNLSGLLKAFHLLQQQQVMFVSITENMDFTTPWGKLALAVLGMLAEIYIDKLSEETKKGKQQRARKGLWNGSIPFGYCNGLCLTCTDPNGPGYCPKAGQINRATDDQPLLPHPIESVGLRRAFKLSAINLLTDREIADRLNRQPVRYQGQDFVLRPKRQPSQVERFGPAQFSKDNVRELLVRVFYTGMVPYFGVNEQGQKRKRQQAVSLHPGQHPALIPQTLFDQVQKTRGLRHNAPVVPGKNERNLVYPLTSLLFCGECGQRMRGSSNKQGKRYYRCATRLQQVEGCHQPTLLADDIEQQLADYLGQLKLAPDWRNQTKEQLLIGEDKKVTYERLQQRWERARGLYLEGDLSRGEYERERLLYREGTLNLTNVPIKAIIATGYVVENFNVLWQHSDGTLKKELLQAMLAAVTSQGNALKALQPHSALYLLLRHGCLSFEGNSCHYGSDGVCIIGDTQTTVLLSPTEDKPLYPPGRLVQELALCTDQEFWRLD